MSSASGDCENLVQRVKTRPKKKKLTTPEERRAEASRLMSKYTSHLPIDLRRRSRSNLPRLVRTKYLVPSWLNVGNVLVALRHDIAESIAQATDQASTGYTHVPLRIRFGRRGQLFTLDKKIGDIYDQLKDADGFLVAQLESPEFDKKTN